jgi:hypothetical protein
VGAPPPTGGSATLGRRGDTRNVRASDRYPELFQFLGAYLHQDWDLDAATADEAVERAIAETPRNLHPAVEHELDDLLASHPDDRSLRAAVADLCDYLPSGDGMSDREWLMRVRTRLQAAA